MNLSNDCPCNLCINQDKLPFKSAEQKQAHLQVVMAMAQVAVEHAQYYADEMQEYYDKCDEGADDEH